MCYGVRHAFAQCLLFHNAVVVSCLELNKFDLGRVQIDSITVATSSGHWLMNTLSSEMSHSSSESRVFFNPVSNIHRYNTRLSSRMTYAIPKARTNYGIFNTRFQDASSFRVWLPQWLTLPGCRWRVALSSMSVPNTLINLYHLVPKHAFLFYTMLVRPGARLEVEINIWFQNKLFSFTQC